MKNHLYKSSYTVCIATFCTQESADSFIYNYFKNDNKVFCVEIVKEDVVYFRVIYGVYVYEYLAYNKLLKIQKKCGLLYDYKVHNIDRYLNSINNTF